MLLKMKLKEATILLKRAVKIKKSYLDSLSMGIISLIPDKAFAFILDNKLIKQLYKNIRKITKSRNANFYPSYENIIILKQHCYLDNLKIPCVDTLF